MRISKQCVIFSLLILSISYDESVAADSPCGDWEPYKDEKCFKVFDKVAAQEDAVKTCSQLENSSTLINIHSEDEQNFLSNLLFKVHKTVENVWIGAKYTSNKVKWDDNSDSSFSNWVVGSPRNETGNECIQMLAEGSSVGKWVNEPCKKNNLIVCQKMQTWSLSRLQQTLLDARKELRDALNNLQQNPVPIGFIYVQLPGQKAPSEFWSGVVWENITPKYAGHFFRAEGGNAAPFGNVSQNDAFQGHRHIMAQRKDLIVACGGSCDYLLNNANQGTNKDVILDPISDQINGAPRTANETRPINYSVRIWERTK